MSSGLSTQALGYIWSLVNKKYIGILTEEELYLALALIAISQVKIPKVKKKNNNNNNNFKLKFFSCS
jgi:hypothetical protein